MTSLEHLLAEHPFCAGLAPQHIAHLAECATTARAESGEFLFRDGEVARAFYVIRHGSVSIASITPHEGLVTIQTVGDGEVLGWSWLVPPYRWHFGAHATEPTTLVAIDAARVRSLCERDHEFGFELMRRFAQVMASRLEAMHLQLLNVYEHHG
jgi:CRP/FNR family cyclic AMP-dependent transcriptional regulator